MAQNNAAPKGTQDVLPEQSAKWQYVEQKMLETAALFGFKEIRPPVFEHTEVFQKSVGDTTDVVQKEMYTFTDKGGRSITLRPERTAGSVRAAIEHGLIHGALPVKVCYIGRLLPVRKAAGRPPARVPSVRRGAASAPPPPPRTRRSSLWRGTCFDGLGITRLSLEINSIGCPDLPRQVSRRAEGLLPRTRGDSYATPAATGWSATRCVFSTAKSPVCSEIAAGRAGHAGLPLRRLCRPF